MKTFFSKSVLMSFLMISGCATQGSLDTVHKEMDAISTRLFSVENGLGNIREVSSNNLSSFEKDYKTEDATLHKTLADIQANIDSTKLDLQAQNGKLDDLAQAVKKPNEDLQRYRDDADKRIISLEDRIIKLQTAFDELNKKLDEFAQQKETVSTPDSLYTKGVDTFKSGNMAAARDLFQNFLNIYPQHSLAADAAFWIGESYYNEKNYDQAILKYQDVINKYPQKDKIPAAMLKQAMSFMAIKDVKSAKYVLNKLTKSFPKSEETKEAKGLLKKVR